MVADAYRQLVAYRDFIIFMVRKQRDGPLFKTVGGNLWLVLDPLAQILIYYFMIVVIFGGGGGKNVSPFVVIMTGLVHYFFLQRALLQSCKAILSNEGLLMQIPLEPMLFCAVNFVKNSIEFIIMMLIFGVIYALAIDSLTQNIIWYPFVLLVLAMIVWFWSIILAVLTVFFRDLENICSIVLRLLLYLSPVIYTLEFVPEFRWGIPLRDIYLLNPMAPLFGYFQWTLLGSEPPPYQAGLGLVAFVALSAILSGVCYSKLRNQLTKSF